MRKLFLLPLLLLAGTLLVQAQDDDFSKGSFFAGYSYNRPDVSDDNDSPNLNGFNVQGALHLNQYFAVKGDVSGHYGSEEFPLFCTQGPCPTAKLRTQLYNFLGGPEVRAGGSRKVQPFAHALVGAAHVRTSFSSEVFSGSDRSSTRFAMALGGGLDVRLNERFDLRVVQVDYNPTYGDGFRSDGVRVSVGIVIK